MENQELLTKLTAAVEKLGGQVAAPQPQPAATGQGPVLQQPGGMLGLAPPQPAMGVGPGMMGQPMPAPTGVLVPVTITLADGRDLPLQVQFDQQAAGNLQQLGEACAAAFGPYLKAYPPKRDQWRGGGGGGGGNYGRRDYGYRR